MAFSFKKMFGKDEEEEYLEIDLDNVKKEESKVIVKPFVLKEFDNIDEILNSLRHGYTIAVIDIKPLKSRDIIELKRAIAKIKKTVDAMNGTIAGFGDNIILATPSFAQIHKPTVPPQPKKTGRLDYFD